MIRVSTADLQSWFSTISWLNLVDWTLVGLLLYWIAQLVRQSRAVLLVRGFLILVGAYFFSALAQLTLLYVILDKVLIGVAVAIPVLFQPELRKLLEQLGRGSFLTELLPNQPLEQQSQICTDLLEAVQELSEQRTGALIVLEYTPLEDRAFSDSGVVLDAAISSDLLISIFAPKTPLHDGAVLIRGGRIQAARVILPIADRVPSRQLGTRHRAAIGITEQSDCRCIVVSEETGSISLTRSGTIQRALSLEELKLMLTDTFPASNTLSQIPDWFKKFFLASMPRNV